MSDFFSLKAGMGIEEEFRDREFLRATWEAISALRAFVRFVAGKPVPGLLEHLVAILSEFRHAVSDRQIAQPQDFGDIDSFRARKAFPAERAVLV